MKYSKKLQYRNGLKKYFSKKTIKLKPKINEILNIVSNNLVCNKAINCVLDEKNINYKKFTFKKKAEKYGLRRVRDFYFIKPKYTLHGGAHEILRQYGISIQNNKKILTKKYTKTKGAAHAIFEKELKKRSKNNKETNIKIPIPYKLIIAYFVPNTNKIKGVLTFMELPEIEINNNTIVIKKNNTKNPKNTKINKHIIKKSKKIKRKPVHLICYKMRENCKSNLNEIKNFVSK